jgi:uncharacterized Zn finger protein
MSKANPELHLICGYCGSGKEWLEYEVYRQTDDDNIDDVGKTEVNIHCTNCGSIIWLGDVIKQATES